MSSLYALTQEFDALANDEELTDDQFEKAIADLCKDINAKGDNIALFLKNLKAEADALKIEASNLKQRQANTEKKIDTIKRYAMQAMDQIGIKTIGEIHKLNKCGNGGLLPLVYAFDPADDVEIERNLPKVYLKYKPVIDTEAIRADLNEGKNINKVAYGERGSHLRVK